MILECIEAKKEPKDKQDLTINEVNNAIANDVAMRISGIF